VKEVNNHIISKHRVLLPMSQVPKGVKVLDSVWSMKRKRDIKTRNIYKHKARLNVHGGQQELQRHTGRVWNKHLTSGLLNAGFAQSKVDDCVFYRGDLLFMVYVDDGIFFCPTMSAIDQSILELRAAWYDTEDMGDVNGYLGINFESLSEGKIKLSQPHLIAVILRDVGLPPNDSTRRTPGRQAVLGHDLKGDYFDGRFHYRAAVGKLNCMLDQLADIFTKPLSSILFEKHRKKIAGK
jgi:hypothetical protein